MNVLEKANETDAEVDDTTAEDLLPAAYSVLSTLPPNWPDIPQLQESHSWDYSTAIVPSINKAREHLNLLQLSVEHRLQSSGTSKHALVVSRPAVVQRNSPDNSQFEVQGIGLTSINTDKLQQLSISDVIDEAISLLAWLERDRQMTVDKLNAEKQRVAMLSAKIDRLAIARLLMLPDAVQKEHEACAKDLAELNWHVTYRSRMEVQLTANVKKVELLNSQLREEIDRLQKHIPLMQEKVVLEHEAMVKIKEAQDKTDEELRVVLDTLAEAKRKSADVFEKADKERATMKMQLDDLQRLLDKVMGQLADEKSLHEDYVKKCNDYKRRIQQCKQDLPTEKTRHDQIVVRHANQTNKVEILETRLQNAEVRHTELEKEYQELLEDATKQRAAMQKEEENLKAEVALKEVRLRDTKLHNKELAMDNENMEKKIENFDKQHEADRKFLDRLSHELDHTNTQLAETLEELSNVELTHKCKHELAAKQQDDCFANEQTLKTSIEILRKTIKEEMQRKQTLRAKIDKGTTDTEVARVTAKTQQDTCANKEAEVKRALAEVRGKVNALQTTYDANSEVLSKLQNDLSSIQQQSAAVKEACGSSVAELMPQHQQIKAELTSLEQRLNEMNEGREMMTRGLEDMDSSSVMIDRASCTVQQEIDALQSQHDELTMQLNAVQTLKDDLASSIKQTTERDADLHKHHGVLMLERNEILQKHSDDLSLQRELNQSLASKYRQLQQQVIVNKTELLNTYDERIKLENEVKDAKQMLAVQQRLHGALQQYYKYRGLYTVGELSRMQSDSKFNTRRVVELQHRIDDTLTKMTRFIHSQLGNKVELPPADSDAAVHSDDNNESTVTVQSPCP